ncbi:MAG: type I glyceraldehyde-3-phosphate dehydrogenase [Bacteroidales bacterium]
MGINGFGRIGRMIFRAALERPDLEVVAINDLLSLEYIAYLLKYDSVHGSLKYPIEILKNKLYVNGKYIRVTNEKDPAHLNWGELNIDYAIEATGKFLTKEKAEGHLRAGAKMVILSAPSEDNTPMFVCGVNLERYKGEKIISNASCTTNCLAPIAHVLEKHIGIEEGLMTTIHPITGTQKVVDSYSKRDYRAGRSGLSNIIPYHTGAAKSIGRIIPELTNKLTGICLRIPTLDVSAIDLSVRLKKQTSLDNICQIIKHASENEMAGIIKYIDEEVVSSDFLGEKTPSVFDARASLQISDEYFKLIAWYDNEIGYSNKLLDLIRYTYTYNQTKTLDQIVKSNHEFDFSV